MAKAGSINFLLKKTGPDPGKRRSALLGFFISALGSSFMGPLNILAIQLTIENGWQSALMFSSGCAITEGVFVRYSVDFTNWVTSKKRYRIIFDWVSLALFLILTVVVLQKSASVPTTSDPTYFSGLAIPTFLLGLGLRIIYPSMIPYWLTWNAVFASGEIKIRAVPFALAVAAATLIMHSGYIFAGQMAIDFLSGKVKWLMRFLGVLLTIATILHIRRMFFKKHKQPAV